MPGVGRVRGGLQPIDEFKGEERERGLLVKYRFEKTELH